MEESRWGEFASIAPSLVVRSFLISFVTHLVIRKFSWATSLSYGRRVLGFFIFISAVALFGSVLAYKNHSVKNKTLEAESKRWNSLSEDEKKLEVAAKEKLEEAKVNKANRQTLAVMFAKTIKDSMRDPQSFSVEGMRINDDATLACIKYRAKNGFGGVNLEFAVYSNGKVSQDSGLWNAKCTKPLHDLTNFVD